MKDVKSMKNTEIAEEVKSAIIKDLFADVDTQKCAIDIFLQNPKAFEKTANTLNKESISFLIVLMLFFCNLHLILLFYLQHIK